MTGKLLANGLTIIQQATFEYIEDYIDSFDKAPTVAEITQRFDLKSVNTVTDRLWALQRKGFIERDPPRGTRNIKIVDRSLIK